MVVKFFKIDPSAEIPSYATHGAAGLDVKSIEEVVIQPQEIKTIRTGISVELPDGFEMQVRPRSGLASKYGITVLNTPGTIDSDYRGEIKVILINLGKEKFVIKPGDRIAQLVVQKVEKVFILEVENVQDLSSTERGINGFGSTGIN